MTFLPGSPVLNRRTFTTALAITVLLSLAPRLRAAADSAKTMDLEKSVIRVHVFKTGLFSAFGHEHEISAPVQEGTISEEEPAVDLTVATDDLRVKDQDVSDKDRDEIQKTMLGPEVLDSQRYPKILFHSNRVEQTQPGKWLVRGDLTLHGETHEVSLPVELRDGHYVGSVRIRQKDFGITPVSVAGGSVKVKNEVRLDFDIVAKSQPSPRRGR